MNIKNIKILFFLALSLAIVIPTDFTGASILEPGFEVETIASGFTLPTSMAFADARIFIAEKGGTVRVIKNGILLPKPVITLTDINTFGDRGLIGIAADPNFASNGYIYLSYTHENTPGLNFSGPKTGRIVRVTVIDDIASESSKIVLVGTVGGNAASPSCDNFPSGTDCIPSDSMSHSVGGLRFGPDGKLYASFGDASNFDTVDSRALRAQNLDSLAGKLIRINIDGTAPSDNPFYNGEPNANRSKVYALGIRNGFRFNFQPGSGTLFLGDVGWSTWEEVNRVISGANFGWPCHEGTETTAYACAASSTVSDPVYVYRHDTSGAGSIVIGSFPNNGVYPVEYNDSLFLGDYAQNWIKRLPINADGTTSSVESFMDAADPSSPNGPVDVSTGPDGNIYFISIYTGDLNRLTHTAGNRRPITVISATPTSGLIPLNVNFSSSGSIDPDNDPITYKWNFGDGSTSTLPNPTHQYTSNNTYAVLLTLTDSRGSSSSKSITINAGNQKPSPEIISPSSGSLYTAGQIVQLNGQATDPEDGIIPAAAYNWKVNLRHNTHTHHIEEFNGVTNPSFTASDHSASDIYTEIVLTVTDSNGLSGTRSIYLYLNNGTGSGNLISNHSLEIEDTTTNRPRSWFPGWYGNLNSIFTYPVTGFDGAKAAQVEINSYINGSAKWYFDPVFVTPTEKYTLSHYYTADVTTAQFAQFGFSNGIYQYQNLGDLPATTLPTRTEKQIIVPTGAQTLTLFHELNRNGVLTVDNYSLTLTSDTVAPTVSIASPTANSTVSMNTVVSVNATDNVGVQGITLLLDGKTIGTEDNTSPYDFAWNTITFANGPHTLTATARDTSGNISTSAGIAVVIYNNLIQNGSLETPNGANPIGWTPGSWGNHTTVFNYPVAGHDSPRSVRTEITTYPADGTGDSKWTFNRIGITPGVEYTYSDYYRSNTVSDVIGQYTLTDGSFYYFGLIKEIPPSATWKLVSNKFSPPANATQITFFHLISYTGFVEIDDAKMYISGTGIPSETNAPIVEFTNPLAEQIVSGQISITASSSDDTAVTHILYAVDGIPLTGQLTNSPYEFSWDTSTVSNGPHTLKATTHDPFGNNSTATIVVTVNNTTPPINNLITNPSLEIAGANGDPQNWFRGGWGTNNRTHTYPVPGADGISAARVEVTNYTSGDAKWYFGDATVIPGKIYTIAHSYRSNTNTGLTARYTKSDGTVMYVGLRNLAPAATWTTASENIVIPTGVISLSLFHSLSSDGWLDVDDFSLIDGNLGAFNRGMISFTLDDGWLSQYTNALPILNTAGINGTFFITSEESLGAIPDERITNPSLEIAGANGDPQNWFRGGWGTNNRTHTYPVPGADGISAARVEVTNYTSGDAKWYFGDATVIPGQGYIISNSYNSNSNSEAVIRYTLNDGTLQYIFLESLAPTSGTWQNLEKTITIPSNAVSLTLFHVLANVGTLTTDKYSLKRVKVFIDPSEILAMESAGHEIAGHTKMHLDLTTLPPAEQQNQIAGSRTDILGMGVTRVDTFAYPYGAYDTAIQNLTKDAGYVAARSVDRGYNTKSTDKFALKIQQVDRTTTLAEVRAWINQAASNKTWLILMFHEIENDTNDPLGTTPTIFQQIVDYAKTANADIVTMYAGIQQMNP